MESIQQSVASQEWFHNGFIFAGLEHLSHCKEDSLPLSHCFAARIPLVNQYTLLLFHLVFTSTYESRRGSSKIHPKPFLSWLHVRYIVTSLMPSPTMSKYCPIQILGIYECCGQRGLSVHQYVYLPCTLSACHGEAVFHPGLCSPGLLHLRGILGLFLTPRNTRGK